MFGMGIYIYAGEDMPTTQTEEVEVKSPAPINKTRETLSVTHPKWEAMANFCLENKTLGYKKLTDKISAKYTINSEALNQIKKIIK
jgi:hypothetical protein